MTDYHHKDAPKTFSQFKSCPECGARGESVKLLTHVKWKDVNGITVKADGKEGRVDVKDQGWLKGVTVDQRFHCYNCGHESAPVIWTPETL